MEPAARRPLVTAMICRKPGFPQRVCRVAHTHLVTTCRLPDQEITLSLPNTAASGRLATRTVPVHVAMCIMLYMKLPATTTTWLAPGRPRVVAVVARALTASDCRAGTALPCGGVATTAAATHTTFTHVRSSSGVTSRPQLSMAYRLLLLGVAASHIPHHLVAMMQPR